MNNDSRQVGSVECVPPIRKHTRHLLEGLADRADAVFASHSGDGEFDVRHVQLNQQSFAITAL
jgi:hypothetical protein